MPSYFGTHRTTIIRDGRGYQWLRSGVEPESRPPVALVSQYLFTRQEQPRHPLPQLNPGVFPRATVSPSISNRVIVARQQPWHPQPFFHHGVRPANPVAGAIYQTSIFVRQEYPAQPRTPTLLIANDFQYNLPWVFAYTVQ